MKLETLTFKVDASAAAKVIEEYAADVAQIVAQRDDMLAALVVAREFISTDRNSLADCCVDPEGGMSPDDAAAVADYDAALLQIDAAIAKATGGAA
jgi:glutathione S-transferase